MRHAAASLLVSFAVAGVLPAGAARAGFDEGKAAFERGDYGVAHRQWLQLARAGDARAQLGVGFIYLLVDPAGGLNGKVTVEWIRKAADQGYGMALSVLADVYERGVEVSRDIDRSVRLRQQAAETGDAQAQYTLGMMYQMGRFVARDRVRAYAWFRLAAGPKSARDASDLFGAGATTRRLALQNGAELRVRLTRAQLGQAEALARAWQARISARKRRRGGRAPTGRGLSY